MGTSPGCADHSYVLPRDAGPLIAQGIVDRRLFDVTRLVRSQHDDAGRSSVPLIVSYDKGRSFPESSLRGSGATVRRDLPSVNGDALRARKSEVSTLWETALRPARPVDPGRRGAAIPASRRGPVRERRQW
ncbi:hypothetical protein [Streptomyces sp. NPDC014676]|uniref:hypothetical protein n=1 Tax=Streptomyces sp. NPDC014676 TaxID=3364879 RepID=UPI0036FD7F04